MILKRINAFFYSIFFLITVLMVILLMSIFRNYMHNIRIKWAMLQRKYLNYKIEQIGEFNKDAQLIIMNHQSILDIVVLEENYPANLCWLAKKEIGDTPILGQTVKLSKMIAVDRKNPRGIVKLIKETKERLEEKRVIAMFPEGTRGRGNKLLKFQSGVKLITEKLNLKVQPIVLIGTNDILNSKDFTISLSKPVKIICLDLIDTNVENWVELTKEKMQETINKYSNKS